MASQGVNVSRHPPKGPTRSPPQIAKSDVNHPSQLQVLRYSALVAGLVYGVYHQSSINSQAKRAEIEHEYTRKERLIEQAKAEWKKKTQPQEAQTQVSGLITDPENPKFDLEAFLQAKAAANP
ncbi:hypothetical protein N7532_011090 [Penicillium argentinense]|uniref:ATP synthase F(0) complex subunit e, mitochondrial n=1 Tax=Penicillium argentinense TaxID=1131581 RepID=A0A9W9EHQ5_9EURO|nr:uncharacterized protein N7532_011090 [Penicillium argentinense]KAJ5082047.1 hypothetical protein N7532_011090 [Penicillium argentinense]